MLQKRQGSLTTTAAPPGSTSLATATRRATSRSPLPSKTRPELSCKLPISTVISTYVIVQIHRTHLRILNGKQYESRQLWAKDEFVVATSHLDAKRDDPDCIPRDGLVLIHPSYKVLLLLVVLVCVVEMSVPRTFDQQRLIPETRQFTISLHLQFPNIHIEHLTPDYRARLSGADMRAIHTRQMKLQSQRPFPNPLRQPTIPPLSAPCDRLFPSLSLRAPSSPRLFLTTIFEH